MSTTTEPQNLGAVVVDGNGEEWVRTASADYPWSHSGNRRSWDRIDNPTVVHEGWVRPLAEPMYRGAQVLDESGQWYVRRYNGDTPAPWMDYTGHKFSWLDIPNPTMYERGEDK